MIRYLHVERLTPQLCLTKLLCVTVGQETASPDTDSYVVVSLVKIRSHDLLNQTQPQRLLVLTLDFLNIEYERDGAHVLPLLCSTAGR